MIRNTDSYDLVDQYITVERRETSDPSGPPPEVEEAVSDPLSSSEKGAVLEMHAEGVFRDHTPFSKLVSSGELRVRIYPLVDFMNVVIADLSQGDVSDEVYFQAKRELQDSIEENRVLIEKLEDAPPRFERTRQVCDRFLRELEDVNSGAEGLIAAFESGEVTTDMMRDLSEDAKEIAFTMEEFSDEFNRDIEESDVF